MKKLNFLIAMLVAVAIVLCSNIVIGQHAPKNILSVSADKLVIVPDATMKLSTLPDFINNARRAQGLTVISAEDIRKFLPTNIYRTVNDQYVYANNYDQQNKDPLVGAWRTLVIDRSYLIGDAPPMDILWYWMFSNIENVETRVSDVDQVGYLPAWIPGEVKNEFIRVIRQGGQIYEKIYVPQGAMFNCTGFNFNGKYTMIDKKLVFLAVDAKTGKRIEQLPFWQITVRFWDYDYTVGFFRDKVGDALIGCNNLGLYATRNNSPTRVPTLMTNQGNNRGLDKGLGTGGVFLSDNGRHNLHQPPPNLPTHPCDTTRTVEGGKNYLVIRCPGELTIKIEVNVNCCPDRDVKEKEEEKIIDRRRTYFPPYSPKKVYKPPFIPPKQQEPCVPETVRVDVGFRQPVVRGFVWLQGEHTQPPPEKKWRGNLDFGITITPWPQDAPWLGFGLRTHADGSEEFRGKIWTAWLDPQVKFSFYPDEDTYVSVAGGLFLGSYHAMFEQYATWLPPFPLALPQKIIIDEPFTARGYSTAFEIWHKPTNGWLEARYNKATQQVEMHEGYMMGHFEPYGRLYIKGWYWYQFTDKFPSSSGQYDVAALTAEEWSWQVGLGLGREETAKDALRAAMREYNGEVGRFNTTSQVILYVGMLKRSFRASTYFSNKLGPCVGLIYQPTDRFTVGFRYTYFPMEWYHNFEVRPTFPRGDDGLYYIKFKGIDYFHDEHSFTLDLGFSF